MLNTKMKKLRMMLIATFVIKSAFSQNLQDSVKQDEKDVVLRFN
jgi:hypothetical protein